MKPSITTHAVERYIERHAPNLDNRTALMILTEAMQDATKQKQNSRLGNEVWLLRSLGVQAVIKRDPHPVVVTILPAVEANVEEPYEEDAAEPPKPPLPIVPAPAEKPRKIPIKRIIKSFPRSQMDNLKDQAQSLQKRLAVQTEVSRGAQQKASLSNHALRVLLRHVLGKDRASLRDVLTEIQRVVPYALKEEFLEFKKAQDDRRPVDGAEVSHPGGTGEGRSGDRPPTGQ